MQLQCDLFSNVFAVESYEAHSECSVVSVIISDISYEKWTYNAFDDVVRRVIAKSVYQRRTPQ